ncbi:phosphatase PAP2 family protein [Aestuariicoccus sp. MJ-SS9]|uniref:phosphatase PAP2 family protein n=1 Tax=Aestuariicoccus sp. MJ-SS9 TaxID=3079855 RepID=UPI0029093599|nr:phosphatase PAP2 family protein [Aestuariicoccus sp. MJ-SS9]MDU8912428.1 phosphatase PAP2 family protein [Aestuariicoccus sp. MJ-SS9]
MALARDGTQHYWNGTASRTPPQAGRDTWQAFKALAGFPRQSVIDQALLQMFTVDLDSSDQANTTGGISIGGQTLATLEKPEAEFLAEHQLHFLRAAADLRGDRMAEIVTETTDLMSFFGMVGYLSEEATKWTLWVANAAWRLANNLEMPLKLGFDVPRPITMSYEVQPCIQTPGHGAWPSGHATESFALATVLTRLVYPGAFDPKAAITAQNELYRHAARIAMNRTVAGVHYPSDSMAGAVLGITMAEALVNLLDGKPATPQRTYHGASYAGDFNLTLLAEALDYDAIIGTGSTDLSGVTAPAWMAHMWADALKEWTPGTGG